MKLRLYGGKGGYINQQESVRDPSSESEEKTGKNKCKLNLEETEKGSSKEYEQS